MSFKEFNKDKMEKIDIMMMSRMSQKRSLEEDRESYNNSRVNKENWDRIPL